MKLPVEENSINHCGGGGGNLKEAGTQPDRELCERACATEEGKREGEGEGQGKYTRPYVSSLFTLKGKGKNRAPRPAACLSIRT